MRVVSPRWRTASRRLGRHALQIEVRRRLYLDEASVEPHDGFLTLRRHMGEIAQ